MWTHQAWSCSIRQLQVSIGVLPPLYSHDSVRQTWKWFWVYAEFLTPAYAFFIALNWPKHNNYNGELGNNQVHWTCMRHSKSDEMFILWRSNGWRIINQSESGIDCWPNLSFALSVWLLLMHFICSSNNFSGGLEMIICYEVATVAGQEGNLSALKHFVNLVD